VWSRRSLELKELTAQGSKVTLLIQVEDAVYNMAGRTTELTNDTFLFLTLILYDYHAYCMQVNSTYL